MVTAASSIEMWGNRNDCFTCDLNGVGMHTTAAQSPRGCPDTVVASRPAVAQAPHIGLAQLHDG
jgi:hypothetical protein